MTFCTKCHAKASEGQAKCSSCGAVLPYAQQEEVISWPKNSAAEVPGQEKSSGVGCLGIGSFGLLWLLCLVLGIAGAIPYGGSNGFFTLWVLLTWGAIIYAAVRLCMKVKNAFAGKSRTE